MGFCFIIIYLTKTIIISNVLSYYTKYKYACSALTFMGCSVIVGLHWTQNHVLLQRIYNGFG